MISKMMSVGLKQALNRVQEPSTDLQDHKKCKHTRKAGDEQGVSCLDCGTALEGYGNMGKGTKICTHKYIPAEEKTKICKYCNSIKYVRGVFYEI